VRITLLFEPSADRAVPFAAGAERYQRLADELARYAGAQVQTVKGGLRSAPADAYVLFAGAGDLARSLSDCGPALAARLSTRIVLLDVSWQKALEQLESHRLAGAVDSLRLSEWLARPSSGTGPFGLRYLTHPLGVSCSPVPALRSAHYCLLQSERHRGLPHLLADYLAAYDRDLKPLSGFPTVSLARVLPPLSEGAGGKPHPAPGRGGSTRTSQVESVSVKRVIESLRRVRESARMTLRQVAEKAGLDADQLGLLEEGDHARATLGTLRAYVLALEPDWGWALAESAPPPHPRRRDTQGQAGAVRDADQPAIVGGHETGLAESPPAADRPWVHVERGMTFLGDRPVRSQEPAGRLGAAASPAREEESYAVV
jgi:transcriptional regulator with XRE-family HTH domain